jgi:hypothetical protein
MNAAPSGPAGDGQSFQAVFREQQQLIREVNGQDVRADLTSFGANFMRLEQRSQVERFNMLSAALPSGSGQADARGWGGSPQGGRDASGRITEAGARAVYSDRADGTVPPILQSALGLPGDADATAFDFGTEIRALTSRFESITAAIREKIAQPVGGSIEASVKHNTEVQALVREADTVSTQRSMMTTLQITGFQEFRSRVALAYEHFTGWFKKLNEMFSQLKQSS